MDKASREWTQTRHGQDMGHRPTWTQTRHESPAFIKCFFFLILRIGQVKHAKFRKLKEG